MIFCSASSKDVVLVSFDSFARSLRSRVLAGYTFNDLTRTRGEEEHQLGLSADCNGALSSFRPQHLSFTRRRRLSLSLSLAYTSHQDDEYNNVKVYSSKEKKKKKKRFDWLIKRYWNTKSRWSHLSPSFLRRYWAVGRSYRRVRGNSIALLSFSLPPCTLIFLFPMGRKANWPDGESKSLCSV